MNFNSIYEPDTTNNFIKNEIFYSPCNLSYNEIINYDNSIIGLEEKECFKKKQICIPFSLNKTDDFKIIPKDENSTAHKTSQLKLNDNKDFLEKNEEKIDAEPEYFSYNDIQENIFEPNKKKFKFKIEEKFLKKTAIKESLINKKRLRDLKEEVDNFYLEVENKEENPERSGNKRGRLPIENNEIIAPHNRMSEDNIIKKIKAEFFKYLITFVNNILNKKKEDRDRIFNLDYKYINQLKREKDLEYLNMKIKDLLSLNVSPKYRGTRINSNRNNIQKILNIENIDDTIMFIFNMTFRDFLNIFTNKINVKDLIKNNTFDQNIDINIEKVEKSLVGIDDLLNKIAENNDANYFSSFCIFLYNYELWFFNKLGRKRESKKKSK